MSRTRRVAAFLLLSLLLLTGARRLGPLPALGPLLDPVRGIWSVATQAELPRQLEAGIAGLQGTVEVAYDDRGVPHVFASSEEDAIRALGFVVARDRLFQLDLQTLAGAGRLTEIGGAGLLPLDREIRGLGLPRAAEQKLVGLPPGSPERRSLDAFADGVNAWIDHLGPRDLPLEYHLLGRRPPRWEPINSIHLLNRMGWTLAFNDLEAEKAAIARLAGPSAADALLPLNSPLQEPIQPNGQTAPRRDFVRVPGPAPVRRGDRPGSAPVSLHGPLRPLTPMEVGSNNWAVGPRRSATARPLLSGDPHLDLSLPSIWYEVHLVVPGRLDAYGVTIPGTPSIIIGFNRDAAWSFTNTDADVADRYAEAVDDSLRPLRYRVDGAWRPLQQRVEIYRDPRGGILAVDTVRYTHRGPLTRQNGWLSLRWTVLDPQNQHEGFVRLMHARSVREGMAAMAGYGAPAQNLLLADRQGSIGIRSTGHFPLRPGDGRGDRVQDGTKSANDWRGYWPLAEYPQAENPSQGYLASANQQPLDPRVNPRYLGADWYTPWRALWINQLLRAEAAMTPDGMRRIQTNPGSARADWFVPALLATVQGSTGDDTLARAGRLLAQWDRRYRRGDGRAVLFESAMEELSDRLWDELRDPADNHDGWPRPGLAVVAELLQDPTNPWWDDHRTPVRESRDDILRGALREGYRRTLREHGDPSGGGWRWGKVHHANIYHLLRIPALSALNLEVDGGPSTISPSSGQGTFGASWRMVVELGPEVRAWGTYPGGQSGNPASRLYLDRLESWLEGRLDSLRFPRTPQELGARRSAMLILRPPP